MVTQKNSAERVGFGSRRQLLPIEKIGDLLNLAPFGPVRNGTDLGDFREMIYRRVGATLVAPTAPCGSLAAPAQ